MFVLATLLLALTRAEIIQRMRAPVVTQADGLVRVYAQCPEDMRREYQGPVASFSAETIRMLYSGLAMKSIHFNEPGIFVLLGDSRTNVTEVVTRVETNGTKVASRIYLKSPGHADINRFRLELVRAFYRSVKSLELDDAAAMKIWRAADPQCRVEDQRAKLEAWLVGDRSLQGTASDEEWDEEHFALMRKVIEPGVASRRDVLTFASRLFISPLLQGDPFLGGLSCVAFRDAITLSRKDPRVRLSALLKSRELPVLGGGKGEALNAAAESFAIFLGELAKGEAEDAKLGELLDTAEARLRLAYETAR